MPKQKYKKRKDGRYATTFHGKPIYANTSKELEDKILVMSADNVNYRKRKDEEVARRV